MHQKLHLCSLYQSLNQIALFKICKCVKLLSPDFLKLSLLWFVSVVSCLQKSEMLQHSGNVYLTLFLSDATRRQDWKLDTHVLL